MSERKTFSAAFEGWCPICHTIIDEGDTVTYEDGKVVHSSCIEDEE